MIDREKVLTGLECLIADKVPCKECPYRKHSYCIKSIAIDAKRLIEEQQKRQESDEKRILKIVWDILHNGVSTDTKADQDWVYEQIRNQVHQVY